MSSAAAETRENRMGTMPVRKLLVSMSIPMMISMLVQALYNIVDSAFVAQINENALSAVSLAFPMQNFMIAVGTGTGVGVNALLSKSLGAKKQELADKTANVSLFLAGMNWLFFIVAGLLFTGVFLRGQTDIPEIIGYGTTYLRICMLCSFGLYMQFAFERLLQATGRTVYSMVTQIAGAVVNIIMDPILIFGLFGFPALGVAGAAIATIFGQFVGMTLGVYFNLKKNTDIHFSLKNILPNRLILKSIYTVAIPSILMVSIGSVMIFFLNRILAGFTTTAVAVFGVYFKLQSFIFMPIFGLNNGMIPIIAYNYGARNRKRIMDTARMSIIIAVSIMLLGLAAFQLFPAQLLLLFDASDHMLEIGVPALRLISLSFLFAGYCIIVGSVFQALGNGMYSLITSVARQLLCILPAAWIFAEVWGLHAVWYSFPLAEIISVVLSTILFKRIYDNKIRNLQ